MGNVKSHSVLIADNQFLVRAGIKAILGTLPQFRLAGEVISEETLLDMPRTKQIDLLIIDYLQSPDFTLESLKKFHGHFPDIPILIISNDSNRAQVYEALELGTYAYVTKGCSESEIRDAIVRATQREKLFCAKVIDLLLERNKEDDEDDCSPIPLSPREVQIVQLTAKGMIAKEVASELNLSLHTVYTHRKNIMKKLEINSVSEMVMYAVNNGIVELNLGAN